jgi:hypothetical protein
MNGTCKIPDCAAPLSCHLGKDSCTECENFTPDTQLTVAKKNISSVPKKSLGWTGEPFNPEDAPIVTARNSPIIISIIGKADAGKTTFLAMLYTLLLSGRGFREFKFAGSKTILGWDSLYHRLKLSKGAVQFPQPTPVNSSRLYHLALRDDQSGLKDILFSDISGEVFYLWAVNRNDENAANARWAHLNANAFMFFIDCDALVNEKNGAKNDILRIARQMSLDLNNRPVIAIWSKSDQKDKVLQPIKDSLCEELARHFKNFTEIDISNFLEPGPDNLVHENNLAAVDWILQQSMLPSGVELKLNPVESNDLFISYKGE